MTRTYAVSRLAAFLSATRILNHSGDTTRHDVLIAEQYGLVVWDLDIEGPYPCPTEKYNEQYDIFYRSIPNVN